MVNSLVSIILTVIIFGVLIGIHELGHYIAARIFGVGIIEFSIGMGPKIYTKQGKNNDFSIRALPIGGFVNMVGEYSEELEDRHKNKRPIDTFKAWQRLIIGVAGPLMNIVFAFVIMVIYVVSSPNLASTVVADKYETDAYQNVSFAYGLQPGDEIVKVGNRNIHVYYDLSYEISAHGNEPIDLEVIRDGERIKLEGVRFPVQEQSGSEFGCVDFKIYLKQKNFVNVLNDAFYQPISIVYVTVDSLIDTFTGRYDIGESVGGPIAIGGAVGDTIAGSDNFAETLSSLAVLTVFISVSLGVCNLLPIPVLDGGMILFCIIEMILRRPIKKEVQNVITNIFAILLIGLMIIVCIKDVIGLF